MDLKENFPCTYLHVTGVDGAIAVRHSADEIDRMLDSDDPYILVEKYMEAVPSRGSNLNISVEHRRVMKNHITLW